VEPKAFLVWANRVVSLEMERIGGYTEPGDLEANVVRFIRNGAPVYEARVTDVSCPSEPIIVISAKGATEDDACNALVEQIIANRDAYRSDYVAPRYWSRHWAA